MIYFVRHGLTDWNEYVDETGKINPKCQGRTNIPLNKNGIAQAESLRNQLSNVKFDKVLCSPLDRAKQTCEIILGSLENVVIDERLIERSFGEFEGLTRTEFDFVGFCSDKTRTYEKAESIAAVENRVFALLDELKQNPNENVLLVSHGGVGCVFASYFDGVPEDGDYSKLIIPNGKPLIKSF
jgi:broad specificity phosphatase PhoE